MADLILRFELFTDANVNMEDVSKRLSRKDVEEIYSVGDKFGSHFRKESSIDYAYRYKKITSVDDICEDFTKEWKQYEKILQELHSEYKFKSFLLFEFDLDGGSHPELVFDKEFISFLSSIGSELQLYFYA